MRRARVGDADDLHARQVGEHTGMIAAHDPDADDAEPNRRVLRGITHVIVHPHRRVPASAFALLACRPAAGDRAPDVAPNTF